MSKLKEIFERVQEQKKEQREINKIVKEALEVSGEYQKVKEQLEVLRLKKLRLEDAARGNLDQKIDLLKLNIKENLQTMSDVALTSIMKGESVKLSDSQDNEYEPVFSVRFKKTSNKTFGDKMEEEKKSKS